MIYKILRPVLFLFDPEKAHEMVLTSISKLTLLYPLFKFFYSTKKFNKLEVSNLHFRNRLGLAAGVDKNGIAIKFWDVLGFSHVEVGTVTPLPQPGNSKPRVFRLKKERALINRLGFNNIGADMVKKNILKARKHVSKDFVIGVNIGKNKDTPLNDSLSDYKICLEKLFDAADYFTINISSPNTEGLRDLHEPEMLDNFLFEIQQLNREISKLKSSPLKCIFLKISPDLSDEILRPVYDSVIKNNINGIIATNTTISRENLKISFDERGGLSGMPLKHTSDRVLEKLNELNKENTNPLLLIGVGGVFSKNDFNDKITSGASLVQIYTGFIYEGPGIIKRLLH